MTAGYHSHLGEVFVTTATSAAPASRSTTRTVRGQAEIVPRELAEGQRQRSGSHRGESCGDSFEHLTGQRERVGV